MNRFDYYEPGSVEEACGLLAGFGREAKVLAGGTDLIPRMRQGVFAPKQVINIKKIAELRFMKEENGRLSIGTLTRLSEIAASPLVEGRFPIFAQAARSIGSVQVRNLATLGGNLCNAAPSADTAPGLLALDATVRIAGLLKRREIPLENFFLGPGQVDLKKDELLTEIMIPFAPAHAKQVYVKHSMRRAMDIAIEGVAVLLSFDETTGVCKKARIAFGAVAPTPVRAKKTEAAVLGKTLKEVSFASIGERAAQEIAPISDVRGSAGYRTEMISCLTIRAIRSLTS